MKMKKILSVLLAGAVVFSVVGCGQKDSGEGKEAAVDVNDMSICTIVKAEEPILDWDPAISYCGDEHTFINMYETLVYYDANTGEYRPQLATEWSSDEAGLVWTFNIREGVKFHDGTDCDAEAVKFSIDRNKGMQQGAAYIWDAVDEVVVIDDHTIEFHLNSPCNMAEVASCQFCAFIYSPTAVGEEWQEGSEWFYEGNACGTGPYMLEKWTAGDSVVLTKFEDYWGGWEGEHFDKAIIRTVSEAATRRQMIESGEADIAVQIGAKNCEALEGTEGLYTIVAEGSSNNTPVWFNVEKEELKDVNVRKALAYAFPYEDVVDNIMFGKYAELPKDVLSPAAGHGSTESQPYHYDLEKLKNIWRKQVIRMAGFLSALRLPVITKKQNLFLNCGSLSLQS